MSASLKRVPRKRSEAGVGMMEVIFGVLAALILGSILLHVVRLGYELYKLNSATNAVAEKLQRARDMATGGNRQVSVIFNAKDNVFGIDRNGNGRLESIEVEEMPEGVSISEEMTVTFARNGSLSSSSKSPHVIISNTRNSRDVKVSSMGFVEID